MIEVGYQFDEADAHKKGYTIVTEVEGPNGVVIVYKGDGKAKLYQATVNGVLRGCYLNADEVIAFMGRQVVAAVGAQG